MEIKNREANDAEWFEAKSDGEIVGFAIASEQGRKKVKLDDIHVIPGMRKKGIGEKLLASIIHWAKSRGASEIVGSFSPEFRGGKDEEAARKFYGSQGFDIDSEGNLYKKID